MKCGSQIAVAVVGGYLLGRSRKTRLAALLALLAAGGKLPIDQRELLSRTPLGGPLEKLTGDLRTQLVDAGMSVAKKAASDRIDSLSDKLQQRAETLRVPKPGRGRERAETEEAAEEGAEAPARRERARPEPARRRPREEPPRRARRREPEEEPDEYDEYEDYDEYEGDEYDDEYERGPAPSAPSEGAYDERDEGPEYDEYEEGEEDGEYEAAPEPERRRPPTRPEPRRRVPRRNDDRSRRGRAAR
jgi:hypothetical protein